MTESEFKIEVPCHDCEKPVPVSADQFKFHWNSRTGYEPYPIYCEKHSQTANAPMIKPQPKPTLVIDGWAF